MLNTLRFLKVALFLYRRAKEKGLGYCALTNSSGVPEVVVFVGIGREAWRVTQRAIEEFGVTGEISL